MPRLLLPALVPVLAIAAITIAAPPVSAMATGMATTSHATHARVRPDAPRHRHAEWPRPTERPPTEATVAAEAPTLLVLITIDQMRGDYLERFAPQLSGGLARLMRGGAWYTNAHHDHAITETAPGHATLLSGRFPRSTGIMMNAIGVEDPTAPLLAGAYGDGASPKRFVGTTLADWLRADQSRSRTLSVSMKDRGAILPVGRGKSDVYWYSPDGRFTTSSYYGNTLPAWVNAFNNRQMPASYAGKAWTLLLPDSAYAEPDSSIGEGFSDVSFPHTLPEDVVDAQSLVRTTPFMDDLVVAFALHGLQSLSLGTSSRTDLLAVSLSATDVIGHRYGPDSREIHDQILRVDRAIGRFLDSLYVLRDSSRVTVVLTGDHGAGTIPELARARGVQPPPVRASLAPLVSPLRATLRAARVDTFAIELDQQLVLVDRSAFRKSKVQVDSLLDRIAADIRALPGVQRVDRFRALLADTLSDPVARRWAHQFPANVAVELIVTLTPSSTWGGNVASHGSSYDYDSNVPLIFYGAGIAPARHAEFVRTVDLAPTLAALARVKPLEKLDGVVLRNALASP